MTGANKNDYAKDCCGFVGGIDHPGYRSWSWRNIDGFYDAFGCADVFQQKGVVLLIFVPCKGCSKRQVGCHSKCDLYNSFREEVLQKREIEKNAKMLDYEYERYKQSSIERFKRKNIFEMKRGRKQK